MLQISDKEQSFERSCPINSVFYLNTNKKSRQIFDIFSFYDYNIYRIFISSPNKWQKNDNFMKAYTINLIQLFERELLLIIIEVKE